MEDNIYIFIIWNKALWIKEKIDDDIHNSFEIIKDIYIDWSNEFYRDNLFAFYGSKLMGHYESKIDHCGQGKFNLIIVKDKFPKYEKRHTSAGIEVVNVNMFDKKTLYRNWTSGGSGHRIHCSNTESETRHDLTVLLGGDFESRIEHINDGETIHLDTKSVVGFADAEDIFSNLNQFDSCRIFKVENRDVVFTYDKYDIIYFLKPSSSSGSVYTVKTNIGYTDLTIIDEKEADLPIGFTNKFFPQSELMELFVNKYGRKYLNWLDEGKATDLDSEIRQVLLDNDVNFEFYKEYSIYEDTRSFFRKCISKYKANLILTFYKTKYRFGLTK